MAWTKSLTKSFEQRGQTNSGWATRRPLWHWTATATSFPTTWAVSRTLPTLPQKLLRTISGRISLCGESRPTKNSPEQYFSRAPSRTRTDTGRILSPLPLPIGLWGLARQTVANLACAGQIRDAAYPRNASVRDNPFLCKIARRAPTEAAGPPRQDDTAVSPAKSLLKLRAPSLRSRKRPSPCAFRP